ncbi:thiamine pyrophosphokinase-related protein [Xylariaceae sp. AK1471]|nr:thiamine pyrophosphokinase-related protein [Xylariaceae sp. AK1471]
MVQSNQLESLLDIVNHCDDFPLPEKNLEAYIEKVNSYYHFRVASVPATLGFVLSSVAREFAKISGWKINNDTVPKTLTLTGGHDEPSRTAHVMETLQQLRENQTFDLLRKWRNELKPAYGPTGEILFSIERSGFPLLGIVAYGIHMVAYTRDEHGDVKRLWISKRSEHATVYPGLFDNTVAGGICTGEKPFATLIREAKEEASLPEELVRQRAKPCGTLSYFHTRKKEAGGEVGLAQPGVHFLYEMELPKDVKPMRGDNEVAEFKLFDASQIKEAMLAGKVKPWFALVVIDFLLRHGLIDETNEPDFIEISIRLHRSLEFPVFGVSFLPVPSSHLL